MDGEWRLVNGGELYDLANDRGQTRNRAAEHPERVEAMRKFYDGFCGSTRGGWRHSPIHIGAEGHPVVTLCHHDLHPEADGGIAWNQAQVRSLGERARGWWEEDVKRPGSYRVTLNRWPPDSGLALADAVPAVAAEPHREGLPAGAAIEVAGAILRVGEVQASADLRGGVAVLEVDLPAGPARVVAEFVTPDEERFPAYYATFVRESRRPASEKGSGAWRARHLPVAREPAPARTGAAFLHTRRDGATLPFPRKTCHTSR